jgi:hypothetical protein
MRTLEQLFEEKRGILDNGAYVRSKASEAFAGSPLMLTNEFPDAPPRDGGLLGIAFYASRDLRVADALTAKLRASEKKN